MSYAMCLIAGLYIYQPISKLCLQNLLKSYIFNMQQFVHITNLTV